MIEVQHIGRVRRKTKKLEKCPDAAAFAPAPAVTTERPSGRALKPSPSKRDPIAEKVIANKFIVKELLAKDVIEVLPHVEPRQAALQLALDLAQVLAGTAGRGRPSADPDRRELRDALHAFRVAGFGPPVGPTDESRKRDTWVEQHAEDHGRTEVNRDDFRALFVELMKGNLSYRYRFDEVGRLVACNPANSWKYACECYIKLGGEAKNLPEKPPRYSHKGVEIRNSEHEDAADAIDNLWHEYRRRRAAPQGGVLATGVPILADLEWAGANLMPKGE